MCEMFVLEGLWGKNTDKEGVAGGRVNAQAFSLDMEQSARYMYNSNRLQQATKIDYARFVYPYS